MLKFVSQSYSRINQVCQKALTRFLLQREEGATAVEYGIMVAAIAAVIITTVFSLGGKVENAFTTVDTALSGS